MVDVYPRRSGAVWQAASVALASCSEADRRARVLGRDHHLKVVGVLAVGGILLVLVVSVARLRLLTRCPLSGPVRPREFAEPGASTNCEGERLGYSAARRSAAKTARIPAPLTAPLIPAAQKFLLRVRPCRTRLGGAPPHPPACPAEHASRCPIVRVMVECPSRSCTILAFTPRLSNRVAQVWRRSYTLNVGRKRACPRGPRDPGTGLGAHSPRPAAAQTRLIFWSRDSRRPRVSRTPWRRPDRSPHTLLQGAVVRPPALLSIGVAPASRQAARPQRAAPSSSLGPLTSTFGPPSRDV
jgi:hypothetical protein